MDITYNMLTFLNVDLSGIIKMSFVSLQLLLLTAEGIHGAYGGDDFFGNGTSFA